MLSQIFYLCRNSQIFYSLVCFLLVFFCGCRIQTSNLHVETKIEESSSGNAESDRPLFHDYPEITPNCILIGKNAPIEIYSIIITLEKDSDFKGKINYIEVKWDEIPIFAYVRTINNDYKLTKYNSQRKWVIFEKTYLYSD